MSSGLTSEQLKRMEENRQKALRLKQLAAQKQKNETTINLNSLNTNQVKSVNDIIVNKTNIPPNSYSTNQTFNKVSTNNSNKINADSIKKSPPKATNPNDPLNGKYVLLEEDIENRFEVVIGYNQKLIELFKTINTRKYDPVTKRWNFALKVYDELSAKIKHEFNNTIKIEPLVKNTSRLIAKFYLIDSNRFEIQVDYNQELQELFKQIKTKSYDPMLKRWSFDLKDYEELVNNITNKLPRSLVSISPLPKLVREIFKEKITKNQANCNSSYIDDGYVRKNIDPTINKSLLPFQLESILFAIKNEGRLLLADDMGLGKTIQGLAIASYYKNDWPLFIISPSSVKFMWKESAKRWCSESIREVCELDESDDVDDFIQVMENGRQSIYPNSKIIITSYDLLSRNIDDISQISYKIIIADECHLLKNSKAQRTKSAVRLIQQSKRVILLSGTPALSRPSELFTQLSAVAPEIFNNFHEFGLRYCDGKETNFGWDFSGYSNMKELRALLEEKVLVRREKKDVMSQLPSKMREMVLLNPALIELNTKSLRLASNKMGENLKGMEKRGALLNYFHETSKVKAKAVSEYMNDLLESGKKFILFAHHASMLDELQYECEKNKFDFIRIDGSTSSEKRQSLVSKFQTTESCLIALLSITAANSGITLTEANLVVFAELFWNPGILVQAEDRVYRIGQKNSVVVQYLCAKGTSDDEMWPLVSEKLSVLSKAGLTKENLSDAKTINFDPNKLEGVKLKAFQDLIEENELCQSFQNTNTVTSDLEKKPLKIQQQEVKKTQAKIDELLLGIDLSNFESPPPKKHKL